MMTVTTNLLPVTGKFISPVAVASVSLAANIAATKAMIEKGVERVEEAGRSGGGEDWKGRREGGKDG